MSSATTSAASGLEPTAVPVPHVLPLVKAELVPRAMTMQRDDLPLPPSGVWHGTFTSRIVMGEQPETAWYKFHPDGRVTGRVENKFVKYVVDGTYDRATGVFTSTGTSGDFHVKHTGTITGHTLEMQFETMARDSGPVTLTFVGPSDPLERVSTRAAAGCYVGCNPLQYPCCPLLACVSAEDENTLRECYWAFPLPYACPETWVRNGDTNWFVEQGNPEQVKDLVSARYHVETKRRTCGPCGTGPRVATEFCRCP